MAVMDEDNYLAHYGILRRSGRYPWGSGGTQSQRNKTFLDMVKDLERQGLSQTQIAEGFSSEEHKMTTTQLRAAKTIALNQQKQEQINIATKLQDKGMSNVAIGKQMGLNESSVRALLAPGARDKADVLTATADMLKRQVEEKTYLGIGAQSHLDLPPGPSVGISDTKFKVAVAMLQEEGYKVHYVKVKQLGTGKYTTEKVLTKPDVPYSEVFRNQGKIRQIAEHSDDGGSTYQTFRQPTSIDAKRVGIIYAEDGGAKADGVIYVRRGAQDLDMGAAQYAQVRIAVNGTHYLKGMAVYKDNMPAGVDLQFNTNKSNTGNKMDAMKEMNKLPNGKIDWERPFGAEIKAGGQRGHFNIVNEEGDWDTWSKNLPSQFLSKQTNDLAKQQLDVTYERRRKELDDITSLTNPTVRKKLLESFADETDSAAVHLKAANMPGQATKVLMPVNSVKETEIYAPSLKNGTRVALVRFPHGGIFEIPELTVNNRNAEAKRLLGPQAKDAVGIHHKVAEKLSGADFDGDTALVLPNPKGQIKSKSALEGLKDFDPKRSYPPYDGMPTIDGGKWDAKARRVDYGTKPDGTVRKPNPNTKQFKMGDVSNLITDMTIRGANDTELAQAVRHSMVVIDAEKHSLDYKASYRENGIAALKIKYQGAADRGASTLISRATSPTYVDQRKPRPAAEGGPIDPVTGRKVYVKTGEKYINKKGELVVTKTKSQQLAETDDAYSLVSVANTPIERLYADHSNKLKALANEARREYVRTPNLKYNKSAKAAYSEEVATLNSKLNVALKNAPRERQAQTLANAVVAQKKAANPDLDKSEIKKIQNQALAEMRVRTGAKKQRIQITQSEWNAIQAGAISDAKLKRILENTDIEVIKKYATPKEQKKMTSSMVARARAMAANGATQAEIAEQLGVSLTTLKTGLA